MVLCMYTYKQLQEIIMQKSIKNSIYHGIVYTSHIQTHKVLLMYLFTQAYILTNNLSDGYRKLCRLWLRLDCLICCVKSLNSWRWMLTKVDVEGWRTDMSIYKSLHIAQITFRCYYIRSVVPV